MRSTIRKICNTIVTGIFVILMIYIAFFTEIPRNTGNFIREKIEENAYSFEKYSEDFKINQLSISMNMFYYNLLTEEQKKIYTSIANGVKNFQEEFVVRDYIAGEKDEFATQVNIAIEAFTNDHPEVFYLEAQYSSYVVSSFEGNYGYIKLNYTEETPELIKEKINLMTNNIESYIKDLDGLSDYEKEIKIHDMLSYNVEYSDSELIPRKYHTAEGALLENVGVCDSFTKALQLIYSKAGINSIIVLGSLDNNAHAWNLVEIDDEWYHVDLTSSHSIYQETGIVNHAYFNLTTSEIKKISTIENENILPATNSVEYNYYLYNGLVIKEDDNMYERLNEICKEFSNENYIEFFIEGNVSEKIPSILVSLKKIDKSFLDGSKMYYYNIQNAIIIPKN